MHGCGPVDFRYPASSRRLHPPITFPASVSTGTPQRRPLPAVLRAHPATSTDCPAVSDGGMVIPRPTVWGPMAIKLPRSRSSCTNPPAVLWHWARHHQLCRLSAGGNGIPALAGNGIGAGLPLRAPAGDLTPIMLVKGTYSGNIQSLDRDPGIASLDPGIQFPGN